MFTYLRQHHLHTDNASHACALFPAIDTLDVSNQISVRRESVTAPLFSHPLWQGGKANVIFHFGDHAVPFPIGLAALAKSSLLGRPQHPVAPQLVADPHKPEGPTAHIQAARTAFDITMPLMFYRCGLPADAHFAATPGVKLVPADERPVILSFQGAAYDTLPESPVAARIRLTSLDNGSNVLVRLSCAQSVPACATGEMRAYSTSRHPKCEAWTDQLRASKLENAGFKELLLNSTFAAVVQGEGAHSYRVIEALRAGSIPVLLDNAAAPFSSAFSRTWQHAAVFWEDTSDYGLYRLLQHLKSLPATKLLDMQAAGRSLFVQLLASHELQVHGLVNALQVQMANGYSSKDNSVDLGIAEPSAGLWPWSGASLAVASPPRLPLKTSYELDATAWAAMNSSSTFTMSTDLFQSLTLLHLREGITESIGTLLLREDRNASSQSEGIAFMKMMASEAFRWGNEGQYVFAVRRLLQWLGFHHMDVDHQQRFQKLSTGFLQENHSAQGEQCFSALATPAERHMKDDPFTTVLVSFMAAEMYGHANMWREGLTTLQLACSAMAAAFGIDESHDVFLSRARMLPNTLVVALARYRHMWLVQSTYDCLGGPKNSLQHSSQFATACDDSGGNHSLSFHEQTRNNLRSVREAFRQLDNGEEVTAIMQVGLRGPEPLPTCTFPNGRATAAGKAHTQEAIASHTTRVKNRIAVVTLCSYSSDKTNITHIAAANRAAYTARHGYANLFHTQLPEGNASRPPAWYKVHFVSEALNAVDKNCEHDSPSLCRAYDWVVWLDCDSLVMNGDIRIEELLWGAAYAWELKQAPLSRQAQLVQLLHGSHRGPDLVISEDGMMINTGVFALRNSPYARHFVRQWWSGKNSNAQGHVQQHSEQVLPNGAPGGPVPPTNAFIEHNWWEQAALLHAMVLGKDAPTIAQQTIFLPQSWLNPYPHQLSDKLRLPDGSRAHAKFQDGDWLISFSGCSVFLGRSGCNQLLDAYAPIMVQ